MYGIEPTSLSATRCLDPSREGGEVTAQEWRDEVVNARKVVDSRVNTNLDESRSRMRRDYRAKSSQTNLRAGDMVLLKNEPRLDGLEPHFRGPYSVIERMGVNVKINIDGGKQKVVHMNRCKAYHPPTEVCIPGKQWKFDHQLTPRVLKPVTSYLRKFRRHIARKLKYRRISKLFPREDPIGIEGLP